MSHNGAEMADKVLSLPWVGHGLPHHLFAHGSCAYTADAPLPPGSIMSGER